MIANTRLENSKKHDWDELLGDFDSFVTVNCKKNETFKILTKFFVHDVEGGKSCQE